MRQMLAKVPAALLDMSRNRNNNNNSNRRDNTSELRPTDYERSYHRTETLATAQQQPYNAMQATSTAFIPSAIKPLTNWKPRVLQHSNTLLALNVTKYVPQRFQIPLKNSPQWNGTPQAITYQFSGKWSRNTELEEYFGLTSSAMNSKYRTFIMPQILYENNQYRVKRFTEWRDWYTYHWQMSRILDIAPELAQDEEYVRDWNEMRKKVVTTFRSDFDNNEQQYLLQTIHLQHLFEPSYDKLRDLRGDKDAPDHAVQEAIKVRNIFLDQYGIDSSDFKMKLVNSNSSTGAYLIGGDGDMATAKRSNNNSNDNSNVSSNNNNSNTSGRDGAVKQSQWLTTDSIVDSKMADEYLKDQNDKDIELQAALEHHYWQEACVKGKKVGDEVFDDIIMRGDLDDDELYEKLKEAKIGQEFDSFLKMQEVELQHMQQMKQLNQEYASRQQKLMTNINVNRRKQLQMRQRMQSKVPEITLLEASDIKKFSDRLSIEEKRRVTVGAATQRKRRESRLAREVRNESKCRDREHHSQRGLKNYNDIKARMESNSKPRGVMKSATKQTHNTCKVKINAPNAKAVSDAQISDEKRFRSEMKKLQEKQQELGMDVIETKSGTVHIKPPQIEPIRPVPPTIETQQTAEKEEMIKSNLIDLVNCDNELKKQKPGMVAQRHQQVSTPLKEDNKPELRTMSQVLKNLGKEDLEKINQILGTAGGQLEQDGTVAMVGPTQTKQRIKPPKVGNEDGQQAQQQQQCVRQNDQIVPERMAVANDNGAQRRVGNNGQQAGGNIGQQGGGNIGQQAGGNNGQQGAGNVGQQGGGNGGQQGGGNGSPVCANVVGRNGAAGGNGAPANMSS